MTTPDTQPDIWKPIETAPLDRDVIVYNRATGPYRSRATQVRQSSKLEWPLRNWNGMNGIWYPRPTRWAPLDAFEPGSVAVEFEQVDPVPATDCRQVADIGAECRI